MALRILYPGDRNTLATLAPAAFTRKNFGGTGATSARITADTADGALGGMVAMYSGDYEANIYASGQPAGIFINDVAGNPFENTPAVASGKAPMFTSMGSYETDIYETFREDGTTPLSAYAAGQLLYASDFGLLTNEATASGVVAVVAKAPSATDPFLGFNLKV